MNELITKENYCGISYTKDMVDIPLGQIPETLYQAIKLSEFLAHSGMVPKDYINNPPNILIAITMGGEVGLKPMASLQNIACINGRPSIWGDALLGLVLAHKDNEYVKESFDTATETATCTVKRKGRDEITETFSFADARKSGIFDKNPVWKTYPKRMAKMRARAFAIRDTWADLLKGLCVVEEQRDFDYAKDVSADTHVVNDGGGVVSSSSKLARETITSDTDNLVVLPEEKKQDNGVELLNDLLKIISISSSPTELKENLHDKADDLSDEHKSTLRASYASKMEEFKKVKKQTEAPQNTKDACFSCDTTADLSSCSSCKKDYCAEHWSKTSNDKCQSCDELD